MKLYDVPRNSKVRVIDPDSTNRSGPPAARGFEVGEVLNFHGLDGMYSFCTDKDGNVVHLKAWAEVEVVV
jgi:hypothetical protein